MTAMPKVVSAEEWQSKRDELLRAEKEATRTLDALAARRRRLPMVRFENDHYQFDTPNGPRRLLDLFGGLPQLAVYQFMDIGPNEFCPGCTYFTENVAGLSLLAQAGVAWVTISDMPLEQLQSYAATKGWSLPIASSRGTSFSADCGASYFMLSLFLTDGSNVFRTYSTTDRGVDRLLFANNLLDLAVYGRQQEWEDSPEGWPQHPTYG